MVRVYSLTVEISQYWDHMHETQLTSKISSNLRLLGRMLVTYG